MSTQKYIFFLQFCQFLIIDNEGPGRKQLTYLDFCTTCDAKNRESLICLLTSWSRVLLEKPAGSQLVKKFPAFYGTRKFITAFTSARHLSLSRGNSIQSIPPHPTSWRSILILSSHLRLCLPDDLFPSGFPITTLYTHLISPICATCPAHLNLLDFITRTKLGEG